MLYESFFGIRVFVYANDHLPPHFHVKYAEFDAIILIETLALDKGSLPSRQLRQVVKWAHEQQDALRNLFHQLNPRLRQ